MYQLGTQHLSKHTGVKHTATVIFFHGSGACGSLMKQWVQLMVKDFTFPHIKVVYPTAPLQSYSPLGGEMSNVWFDRAGISPDVPEMLDSLNKIEVEVKKLIKYENDIGISSDRIIVGWFSMGGALALHTAYRWDTNLAGVFAFGSFLNKQSIVYKELRNTPKNKMPRLLQIHGGTDDLVNIDWGEETFNQLKKLGVQGDFHVMQKLSHSINKRGMMIIKEWVSKHLPDLNNVK